MKVFVATPMFGGMCHGDFMTSMMNLQSLAHRDNIEFYFSTIKNESLIPRARNVLVNQFLETDCTHLFFIDSDIVFNCLEIPTMFAYDRDIICGIYPKKEINWENIQVGLERGKKGKDLEKYTKSHVVQTEDDVDITNLNHEPFEIKYGGTGFMLIKREVFEVLKPYVPKHHHQDLSKPMIDIFFDTSLDGNEYLSEDYHFCNLWKKHGGKIYAAPWVNLNHIGSYTF